MSVRPGNKEASITSYGGVGGQVSGSCHVFESGNNKVVVDCGIYQGRGDLAILWEKFQSSEDMTGDIWNHTQAVLGTHDHADHLFGVPNAFKNGFHPNVYVSEITKRIVQQTLLHSVAIEDKGDAEGSFYGFYDVKRMLAYTKTVKPFDEMPITRDKAISAIFCPNGHTPGSSSIIIKDKSSGKNVLFTGDIGRPNQLLTGGYKRFVNEYPQVPINTVIVESTCYPNSPIPFDKRVSSMQKEIVDTFKRGGNVLMPCINHRYMENTEIIHNLGDLPKGIEFYLDGPSLELIHGIYEGLGTEYFTTRYGDNPVYYKTEGESRSRFNLANFSRIKKHEASLTNAEILGETPRKAIIFASGGMGENGRVCNYLDGNFIRNPKNTVLFSCYQVDGTAGSNLLKAYSRPGYRGARIVKLEGGSSHATGKEEIFGFLERFNLEDLENVLIVHGTDTSRKSMEFGIRQADFGEYVNIKLPDIGERIDLV